MHRVHFAAERLSPPGLALVDRGLREKWTFRKILADLQKATGETLAYSSLRRYAARIEAELRNLRLVREEARAFLSELQAGSVPATDMVMALVQRALFERSKDLAAANPVALSREERERQKLELKRLEMELHREQIGLEKQKLATMEKRLESIRQKAGQARAAVENAAGDRKLPGDLVQQIRDIYGLAEEQA